MEKEELMQVGTRVQAAAKQAMGKDEDAIGYILVLGTNTGDGGAAIDLHSNMDRADMMNGLVTLLEKLRAGSD